MVNSDRIKVLLSAYACEPNKGSEPGVGWNWAINLSHKFDVYVITRSNNREIIEEYLKANPNKNLKFFYYDCSDFWIKLKHKLPGGVFFYYYMWQRGIFTLAENIVLNNNIDIIHHITFNEFRTPGVLYKINKPFIWGPIGGGQFYNPVTKKAYHSRKDIIKEKLRNSINKLYLVFSKNIKNAVEISKAILIADQSTEKIMPKCRKYYRLLETAYNLNRNNIKKYDNSNKEIQLLWVGGIIPRKGLKVLIDALKESKFYEYKLTIIGEGKDRVKNEDLVNLYGLNNNINFIGNLSYEKVNEQYDKADLFIFSSLRDTSGNVVLEAMSHGLPVIAFNHHGVGEIVNNDCGELIDVENYEQMKSDLMAAIMKYNSNRSLLKQKGTLARKRIEEHYTWEKNVDFIGKIYKEIMENNNG